MPAAVQPQLDRRVLLVPPTKKDGEVTYSLLTAAGLNCAVCSNLQEVTQEIALGAGALLLTDNVVKLQGIADLLNLLDQQPVWSDLPIVLLAQGGVQSPQAMQVLAALRNVTLLERPTSVRSVISAVQAAVRARERQYQNREQLKSIRHAESRAREFQGQLEIAVEASELGIFHCEMPLNTIVWNSRCKAHFWLPPDAEVNFDLFYSILHPDDRERTRTAVEACVNDGNLFDVEYRTVSLSGQQRWIRATGRTIYDQDSQPICFDGTTQDITQRKASEAELKETQERFQAMANSIPQLAWMANADGFLFWYNQRWFDYTGAKAEDMEGWGWQVVHDPAELPRVIQTWRHSLSTGTPWEDTFPLRRWDGEFRWHLSRAMPYRDATNQIKFWFGTNTDITEQRRRADERQQQLESEQQARREAERVGRMKDEFLATLSHELRTPLNAIFGWTQLMKMPDADACVMAEGIEVIDRNVRVQTELIEDLLDMSRIISGKVRLEIQPIDILDVVKAAVSSVQPTASAKGVHVQYLADVQRQLVGGDAGRLQQVLWNLLTNSLKFTPRGGDVQVRVGRNGGNVEISVTDSGQGIDPAFIPHIFERFSQADGSTTRKHGGLGLGLSIVKTLVEMHGGTIQAISGGAGRGATFTITIPRCEVATFDHNTSREAAVANHPRKNGALPKLSGLKVLVVDDESDARELVRRFLVQCDAIPALAESADQATEMVRSFAPDVILSDIGMPDKDGYEFMRGVRSQGIKTPAIALSAFARGEDRMRSIQAGYQTHLPKPVEPAELLAVIASLTGRFTPHDET